MKKKMTAMAELVLAASVTAGSAPMAAQASGWKMLGGEWTWTDEQGELVSEAWRKSGKEWYYLDRNGQMARNNVIPSPYGSYFYYMNEEGKNKIVKDREEGYLLILSKESFDMENPDMESLSEEEQLNFS